MTDPRSNVFDMWPARVYLQELDGLERPLADTAPRNLYDSLEERARIAAVIADEKRDIRVMRAQSFVKWGSLVVALVTVIYFAGELARGAF